MIRQLEQKTETFAYAQVYCCKAVPNIGTVGGLGKFASCLEAGQEKGRYRNSRVQFSGGLLLPSFTAKRTAGWPLKACEVQTRYKSKPAGDGIIPTGSFKSLAHRHELSDVFDQLPEKTRLALTAEFQKPTNEELRDQLVEYKNFFVALSENSIDEKLPFCKYI